MSVKSKIEQRQDIVEYILKHADEMSGLSCVKEFVEGHHRLSSETSDINKLSRRLIKAKEQFIPFEKRVQVCKDSLSHSEKELSKLHRPLGQAAFNAFTDGSIKQGRILSDRIAIHERVTTLKKDRANRAPQHDTGITQKAKIKAHQLAITGKIKLEESKIGRLESEIGRQLIQDNLDDSVRCDSILKILDEIAFHRDDIIKSKQEFHKAEVAQKQAINQLCKAIPLNHIESSKTLDDEIKACNKIVLESESSFAEATRLLTDGLHNVNQEILPESLLVLLNKLKDNPKDASQYFREAGEELQEATKDLQRGSSGIGRSVKYWWNGLSIHAKYISIGVFGFLLLIAVFSEDGSEGIQSDKNVVLNPVVLTLREVDEEFKIAASQKGQMSISGAEIMIDNRNNDKWSWERLQKNVDFPSHIIFVEIKDEFEDWKKGRIAAGDRYK